MDGTTMSASATPDLHERPGQGVPVAGKSNSLRLDPGDLGIGHLFWTMRDAVVVGEVDTGTIVLWNPAAERLFGWTAADIVGAPLEHIIPERMRTAHREGLARYAVIGGGQLIDRDAPSDVPAVRKDGTEITVELSLTPLAHLDATETGIPRYVLAFVRDATERTRLAAERSAVLAAAQDYVRRLEDLATMESGFTAMVAHELGGPVAAVGALANLLERNILPADEQRSIVRAIRAEAKILQRLVEDIRTVSAVEREAFAVRKQPIPVATLVADAMAFARTLADDHPLHDDVSVEALAKQVEIDPDRIGQVLRNLLGNAVKHTPPGTGVEVRVASLDGYVRFQVADTGPGISPADLDRIFTKFGRGRDAEDRMTPGTGLGLYVARQILRAHGSDLHVSSTPGQGTVFTFDLESST